MIVSDVDEKMLYMCSFVGSKLVQRWQGSHEKTLIFHSYVKHLPEGKLNKKTNDDFFC